MERFFQLLRYSIQFLGSFVLILLFFFTLIMEAIALPDAPNEISIMNWDVFSVLFVWMLILLLFYLLITRSLIVNLLLLPIIYLWGGLLVSYLNSEYAFLDILSLVVGLIVCIVAFITPIVRDKRLRIKWNFKEGTLLERTIIETEKREVKS